VRRKRGAVGFAASQPVEALVVDDTGFPKDGTAVAVRGPAVLRHAGQDRETARVAVSVHLVNEAASCAAELAAVLPGQPG